MRIQDQLRAMGQETHCAEWSEAADYIDRLEAIVEAAEAYFDALDDFNRRHPAALGGPGQGDVRRALRGLMLSACPHGSTMESCGSCEADRGRALELFPSLRRYLPRSLAKHQSEDERA